VSRFAANRVVVRKKTYMAQMMSRLRMRLSPLDGIWKSASNQFAPEAVAAASRAMITSK